MTCPHVLGLIDAGPFADYPRAHVAAAWQHARQCPTCGPALEAASRLTADLQALAQPAPPPELASVVLARIARIDQDLAAPAAARPEARARASIGDWSVQAAALGGLAAAVAIVMSMPPGGGLPAYIASPAVGGLTSGLVAMPSSGTYALILATGLMLYVAGLFAPLGGGRGRPR